MKKFTSNIINLADYPDNRSKNATNKQPFKETSPSESARQHLESLEYIIVEPRNDSSDESFDEPIDESFAEPMLYAPNGNPIGNFLAWPVTVNYIPGNRLPSSWTIAGELLETGEQLPQIDLTPTDFKNVNWVIKKWGIAPEMAAKASPYFKSMIRQLTPYAKCQYLCKHLGWQHIEGHHVFVHIDGTIGTSSIHTAIDTSSFDHRIKYYQLPSRCKDFATASGSFLSFLDIGKPDLIFPVLAVVLAAPLATLMRKAGVPLDFVPFLVGKTQEGKSSIAALCQSMFGDFNKQRFPASFRDTAASLEPMLATVHDMLTVIDDYHPRKSGAAADMDNFAESLDRMIADGNSRKRMGQSQQQVEGVVLCTGETRPNICESGLARYLFIDVAKQDLYYTEKLLPLMEQTPLLCEFMVAYIKWIGQSWNQLQARLQSSYQSWLGHFPGQTGRTPESCAKLGMGFEIGMGFLLESGAIDEGHHTLFMGQCRKSLQRLLDCQVGQKPTELYLSTLSEMLTFGSVKLCPSAKEFKDSPRLVGFTAGDKVYLHPARSFSAVNARLQKKRSFAELPDTRDMLKLMADENYVTHDSIRQRHTRQHRTGTGSWQRKEEFIVIPLSMLQGFEFFASIDKTA